MELVGANQAAIVTALDELPGKSNYFIGKDPKKWLANVSTYAKVKYQNIYPGVDLIYYGNQGQLEYDFVVAPGADPKAIALSVEAGLSRHDEDGSVKPPLRIDAAGNLAINTDSGEVRFHKPVVYQDEVSAISAPSSVARDKGRMTRDQGPRTSLNPLPPITNRRFLDGHYVLTAGNRVGFEIAAYDRNRPLIIDPVLSYSTYLGGSGDDYGNAIAVDASGDVYVAGSTASTDFPPVSPLQASLVPSENNCHVTGHISGIGNESETVPCPDVFVTKLDPTGTTALYSTYLGGSNNDFASGIAVDSSGNAYVTGSTGSTDFPTTTGAFDTSCGTGSGCNLDANGNVHPDAFVAKLGPAGDALVYATYLGGKSAGASARGIAVDQAGNAYVTGSTASTDFPTANPFQKALGGPTAANAFVSELNTAGSALVYSTYLGGSISDGASGIAVDSSGNTYVAGSTISTDFPTTTGAFKTTCGTDSACNPDTSGNKQGDAFVSKFDPSGSKLLYSTYLGGSGADSAAGIAVDVSGNAYVSGSTSSTDFPTLNPFQAALAGGFDAFVTKLNPAGSALVYSTYLGGSLGDAGSAIVLDASGNAYVTGETSSTDFPTSSPLQASNAGGGDAFIAKLDPSGSGLAYSTLLGRSGTEYGGAIAVDSSGNALVTGATNSLDFPMTLGAFMPAPGGGSCLRGGFHSITSAPCFDAFVVKIGSSDTPGFAVAPPSLNFGVQAVSTSTTQTITLFDAGSQPLTISSLAINGTNAGDFSETTTCALSLATVAGGSNCAVSLTFSPQTLGTKKASLVFTDDASGSPHSIPLTGVSATPPTATLSATSLSFGSEAVGSSSSPQTITLTNTGGAPLSITGMTLGPDFGLNSPPGTCASTVNGGTSCTIGVTFSPQTAGTLNEALTITDNAANSPQTVALSGNGTADFVIGEGGGDTIVAGGTATFPLLITPEGGFNQAVSFSCNGAPPLAMCAFSPNPLTLDGTNQKTVTLTVTTTAPTVAVPRVPGSPEDYLKLISASEWVLLSGLLMLATGLGAGRKKRLTLALALAAVLAWAGCGGVTHKPGTPPGNYTLIVTGVSGTLSHNWTVTLTVNP